MCGGDSVAPTKLTCKPHTMEVYMYVFTMYPIQLLPTELNNLIFAYANMRYYAGKLTQKFHPHDARFAMLQVQLGHNVRRKRVSLPSFPSFQYTTRMIFNVTRFKYIVLKKTIDVDSDKKQLDTKSYRSITYHVATVFTYHDIIKS